LNSAQIFGGYYPDVSIRNEGVRKSDIRQGYTDVDIFLMLYHKNDFIIEIKFDDGIVHDLTGVVIDVLDDDVNVSRVKREFSVQNQLRTSDY